MPPRSNSTSLWRASASASTFDQDGGGWGIGGGTSAATPLTAAIVALVLEQERKAGRPRLGSLPPLLYELARGRAHAVASATLAHHNRQAAAR